MESRKAFINFLRNGQPIRARLTNRDLTPAQGPIEDKKTPLFSMY
jgi:hypothetical protein